MLHTKKNHEKSFYFSYENSNFDRHPSGLLVVFEPGARRVNRYKNDANRAYAGIRNNLRAIKACRSRKVGYSHVQSS